MEPTWLSAGDIGVLIPAFLLILWANWKIIQLIVENRDDTTLYTSKKNLRIIMVTVGLIAAGLFAGALYFLGEPPENTLQRGFDSIHVWVVGVMAIFLGITALCLMAMPAYKLWVTRNLPE